MSGHWRRHMQHCSTTAGWLQKLSFGAQNCHSKGGLGSMYYYISSSRVAAANLSMPPYILPAHMSFRDLGTELKHSD